MRFQIGQVTLNLFNNLLVDKPFFQATWHFSETYALLGCAEWELFVDQIFCPQVMEKST